MIYKVRIGDEVFEFSIRGAGSALEVSRNGSPLEVDLHEVGPGAYSLIVAGKSHLLTARKEGDGITIRLDGRTFAASVGGEEAPAPGDRREDLGEEKEVRSMMPGIVTRLLVHTGDPVEAGTPLLVLEAMKMENEVRSHRAGAVAEIHVSAGETVETGRLLLTIR